MGSAQNTVYYCCVSNGNRILYAYSGGDREIENLAALCLERTPTYHAWYFQTTGKRTFGFFIEDGYVFFAIANENIGNRGILRFLEHVRDEFRKVTRKSSSRSISNSNSLSLQDQLIPVICQLINSLESVSQTGNVWPGETPSSHHAGLSPSPSNEANGQIEVAASTKIPLLAKSSKQEKKKMKDHVIAMKDIELEEQRNSADRRGKFGSGTFESDNQSEVVSSASLNKDIGSMRIRSSSHNIRKKWCCLVWIVLTIDVAVCVVLFGIWLIVCGGIECIR